MIILSKNKKIEWYNSGNAIINIIIAIIIIIIICSQSFANNEFSIVLFSSVINRNSIYLLVLIYFILLKTSFGRRYFNYLNVFLIFIYLIGTITSLLTMIQFFSLNTVLNFLVNIFLLIYSSHTFFRDTVIWREFHFYNSPFNELTNESSLYSIIVIAVFSLAVNLISTVDVSGVAISTLNAIFIILLGRYIFLYRDYLDKKKLDSNNAGNFDDIKTKIQTVLDKTDLDDKIIAGVKSVVESIEDATSKAEDNHVNIATESVEKTEAFKEKNVHKKKVQKGDK